MKRRIFAQPQCVAASTGTTFDVQRSASDSAKRKLATNEDYDPFEAYSQICARNTNSVSNTHCLHNEDANGTTIADAKRVGYLDQRAARISTNGKIISTKEVLH